MERSISPCQSPKCMFREAGQENEEVQRISASRDFDRQCQGVAMKGFWLALIVILTSMEYRWRRRRGYSESCVCRPKD